MNIPSDPAMLFIFINMKLRDQYRSLHELFDDLLLTKPELMLQLQQAGFEYIDLEHKFW